MRGFSCYRIDYISDTLTLLTEASMQLYWYASVYADISSGVILLLIYKYSDASVCYVLYYDATGYYNIAYAA